MSLNVPGRILQRKRSVRARHSASVVILLKRGNNLAGLLSKQAAQEKITAEAEAVAASLAEEQQAAAAELNRRYDQACSRLAAESPLIAQVQSHTQSIAWSH